MAIIQFDDEAAGITLKSLRPFTYYEYGEAFFGSYRGMRYRVAREPLKNIHFTAPDKIGEATLRVSVWPQPYSYAATDPSRMTSVDFPFTPEGLIEAAGWLNRQYDEHKADWPSADYS